MLQLGSNIIPKGVCNDYGNQIKCMFIIIRDYCSMMIIIQ